MGLVGEKVQRKSVRSKSITRILRDPDNKIQNEMLMDELLCNIFFIYLNSSCQNKTVIILEKVYTPRYILELMANIMFNKLKI
jgi:actin-related protein